MSDTYVNGIKRSLVGDPDASFVLLCNFEVEHAWSDGHVGLPGPKLSTTAAIVDRMEQMGALLGGPSDVLVLGGPLDAGYRAYVADLGFRLPQEIVLDHDDRSQGTTAGALNSPETLARLRELARGGAHLMPMGVSRAEQRLAEATGLALAGPDSGTSERVNSKIYSRRLVEDLGLTAVPGYCVETVEELGKALEAGRATGAPLIVKEAFGVSGKGLLIVDTDSRAHRLMRMAEQRAARTGSDALDLVVEHFLAKKFDLNYQFTIDRAGGVRFDFVKQALTANGVHLGHALPAALRPEQHAKLRYVAQQVGARLFADGFFGVVGVDAILGSDDTLYPVLEINARLNMSSYQGGVVERFGRPGAHAVAKHYSLRLAAPVGFHQVRDALGPLAQPAPDGSIVLVTCFGTLNAAAPESGESGRPFDGRLYTMLFGPDRSAIDELDRRAGDALGRIDSVEVR